MKWAKQKDGFTIVELLIVVVVIAILAAITIVSFTNIRQRAEQSATQSNTSQAIRKIEAYRVENGGSYPATPQLAGLNTSTELTYTAYRDGNGYCVQSIVGSTAYYATHNDTTPRAGSCGPSDQTAWWRLNGNGAEVQGTPSTHIVAGVVPGTGQNGQPDGAMVFSRASGSSIQVSHSTTFATPPETFSFWVRPTAWTSSPATAFIAKRSDTDSGFYIGYLNSQSSIIIDCGGQSQRFNSSYAPPLNTWTHIAVTCSNTSGTKLYTNGAFHSERPSINRATMSSTEVLRFGRDTATGSHHLDGSMDDIRFFSRVLTPAEIQQLYTFGAQ